MKLSLYAIKYGEYIYRKCHPLKRLSIQFNVLYETWLNYYKYSYIHLYPCIHLLLSPEILSELRVIRHLVVWLTILYFDYFTLLLGFNNIVHFEVILQKLISIWCYVYANTTLFEFKMMTLGQPKKMIYVLASPLVVTCIITYRQFTLYVAV